MASPVLSERGLLAMVVGSKACSENLAGRRKRAVHICSCVRRWPPIKRATCASVRTLRHSGRRGRPGLIEAHMPNRAQTTVGIPPSAVFSAAAGNRHHIQLERVCTIPSTFPFYHSVS